MKTLKVFIIATIISVTGIAIAHQDLGEMKYRKISQSEAIMIAVGKISEKVNINMWSNM